MIRMARDFRLIPVVLLATICLFVLKVSGIVFDGGYTLAERLQGRNKSELVVTSADSVPDYPRIVVADGGETSGRRTGNVPWTQEMFNFSGLAKSNDAANVADTAKIDVTGSVNAARKATAMANAAEDITYSSGHGDGEKKPEGAAEAAPPLKTSEKAPEPTRLDVGGEPQPLAPQGKINSPGERAVLGRLQDRRQELEERNRELDMRESLLKAAEKRLDAKVSELKDIEARIKVASNARDEAEIQRFKGIVSMYENMKPKDAARIFDRLDMRILAEVATSIKSRTMSEILAQMSPDSAEKLTVELANRANAQTKPASAGELPKIDGKPRN